MVFCTIRNSVCGISGRCSVTSVRRKGRYRQFHQLGCEVFGLQGPDIDAELIMLTARWWRALGISEHVTLELNSIGSLEARANYRDALVAFLEQHKEKLDEDCKRRMYT